jgi:adenylate cyclase
VAAGREIERKFLVSAIPQHPDAGTRILQGYLPLTSEETEVRVRRKGDATVLTVKHGRGLDRSEEEVAISSEVFDALWPLTEGSRIEKTRYEFPHGDATIELRPGCGAARALRCVARRPHRSSARGFGSSRPGTE